MNFTNFSCVIFLPQNALILPNCILLIVKRFLLAGNTFTPEMHLKKPGFIYNPWEPYTKNKEGIQKFKGTCHSTYIYQNELHKACFQGDMAYGRFKGFPRRTVSDKLLRDKVFNLAKNPTYVGYQHELASMIYKFFDKRSSGDAMYTVTELSYAR